MQDFLFTNESTTFWDSLDLTQVSENSWYLTEHKLNEVISLELVNLRYEKRFFYSGLVNP